MGTRIARVPEDIEDVVVCYWTTDVRGDVPSETAQKHMAQLGNRESVRKFLLDVILHDSLSPTEWANLCEVHVTTAAQVRQDGTRLWNWLFDGEPLPQKGGLGPQRPRKF